MLVKKAARQVIELTVKENFRFERLLPLPGEAWAFWGRVAYERGLDYRTIVVEPAGKVTALPLGHKRHWCYPAALKLRTPPPVLGEKETHANA